MQIIAIDECYVERVVAPALMRARVRERMAVQRQLLTFLAPFHASSVARSIAGAAAATAAFAATHRRCSMVEIVVLRNNLGNNNKFCVTQLHRIEQRAVLRGGAVDVVVGGASLVDLIHPPA